MANESSQAGLRPRVPGDSLTDRMEFGGELFPLLAVAAAIRQGRPQASRLLMPMRTCTGGLMLNQDVKRLCIEVLQHQLLGVAGPEPVAIGAKLVRAGAAPEDIGDIWSGVVSSIARYAGGSTAPGLEMSDPMREFLAEYRKVMRERPCRSRRIARRSPTRRIESRPIV